LGNFLKVLHATGKMPSGGARHGRGLLKYRLPMSTRSQERAKKVCKHALGGGQWIPPIGPQSLLIDRATSRHVESSAWLPLRVDLAGQDVSVFDPHCINAWTGTILHRRTIVRTSGRRR
jgi:hypothetical protein